MSTVMEHPTQTYEPFPDEIEERREQVIETREAEPADVSVEDVVSEALTLERRHLEEKEALHRKKQQAILKVLQDREEGRRQFKQAEEGWAEQLSTLGYESPAEQVFKSHETRQIASETAVAANGSAPAKKRAGRPPGSGKKAIAAAPEPVVGEPKKRGRKPGSKLSEETKLKMKAAHAKRKKEKLKAEKAGK